MATMRIASQLAGWSWLVCTYSTPQVPSQNGSPLRVSTNCASTTQGDHAFLAPLPHGLPRWRTGWNTGPHRESLSFGVVFKTTCRETRNRQPHVSFALNVCSHFQPGGRMPNTAVWWKYGTDRSNYGANTPFISRRCMVCQTPLSNFAKLFVNILHVTSDAKDLRWHWASQQWPDWKPSTDGELQSVRFKFWWLDCPSAEISQV